MNLKENSYIRILDTCAYKSKKKELYIQILYTQTYKSAPQLSSRGELLADDFVGSSHTLMGRCAVAGDVSMLGQVFQIDGAVEGYTVRMEAVLLADELVVAASILNFAVREIQALSIAFKTDGAMAVTNRGENQKLCSASDVFGEQRRCGLEVFRDGILLDNRHNVVPFF